MQKHCIFYNRIDGCNTTDCPYIHEKKVCRFYNSSRGCLRGLACNYSASHQELRVSQPSQKDEDSGSESEFDILESPLEAIISWVEWGASTSDSRRRTYAALRLLHDISPLSPRSNLHHFETLSGCINRLLDLGVEPNGRFVDAGFPFSLLELVCSISGSQRKHLERVSLLKSLLECGVRFDYGDEAQSLFHVVVVHVMGLTAATRKSSQVRRAINGLKSAINSALRARTSRIRNQLDCFPPAARQLIVDMSKQDLSNVFPPSDNTLCFTHEARELANTISRLSFQDAQEYLGEILHPKVEVYYPKLADKLTGMMMELETSMVIELICCQSCLLTALADCVNVLNAESQSKSPQYETYYAYGENIYFSTKENGLILKSTSFMGSQLSPGSAMQISTTKWSG